MVLSAKVTMNLPNTAIVTVATELPRRRPQMPIATPDKKRLPAPHQRLPIKSMNGIVSKSCKGLSFSLSTYYMCKEGTNRR